MKISKLKALTIATSVVGTASLGSVIGLTTVAVTDQNSQNQDYSQTGNGSDNNLTPSNPENPSVDNNPSNGGVPVADVQKLFTNQKTIQPSEKVFDALDQIKTINDLWQFYSRPANIPSNFSIGLSNVKTTTQTPDSNLGLQVTITINGNTLVTFVVYGFSPYTDQDYKRIFEAANPSGKFMKNGLYFPYLDWRVLSKEPSDPNYFGNYFKPVIPRELSANNIAVTPDWFNLSPNNVVNYYYVLHSQDNKVSVKASVPVSASYEYQYPISTNAYKPVTKDWKPVNFDFINANLPANYTRADFDKVVWQRWNGSTLADAINAYRYWYLFDQSSLTSKLISYILSTKQPSTSSLTAHPGKYPIGFVIRGGDNVNDITSPNPRRNSFNPNYDASMNLNGSKSVLSFNWHLPYLINDFLRLIAPITFGHHLQPPYNIDAGLNINFDSKKPANLNKDGLVEIPVTVKTDVILNNHDVKDFVYKTSHVVKQTSWTILDALYQYFKIGSYDRSSSSSNSIQKSTNSGSILQWITGSLLQSGIPTSKFPTPFFSQFSEALKQVV